MDRDEAERIWKSADAVCLDVDSTVIRDEAIDILAQYLNKAEEIGKITNRAMCGEMDFRESLQQRLTLLAPSQRQIADFKKHHPPRFSPGIHQLVETLRESHHAVFLISGGFHCLIEPVADELGIARDHVIANKLLFDYQGNYASFDSTQPTCSSGGKSAAVRHIIATHNVSRVVMVGDGVTDAEAAPPAALFIGYGGNVVRERVRDMCSWFITDFQQLTNSLL